MIRAVQGDSNPLDYRFSLANERTYLAWIRTSLALVAGGIAAAKALEFDHDVWRWVVAAPPILAGAAIAAHATARWREYESAMTSGRPLPVGRGLPLIGFGLAVYAVLALVASAIDG
jgi:inner membrane protein YidH